MMRQPASNVSQSNVSQNRFRQLCQRVALSRTLADAFGSGSMSGHYQRAARQAGWTTEQLLTMAAAKGAYN